MVISAALYTGFIALTACERIAELVISRRNAAWSFARGGREYGREHFPAMVVLHTVFLLACPLEVIVLERGFDPLVGGVALILALGAQALRWWVITTLGNQWNTRVIVVPGQPRVTGGPFRYVRHPNYLAVVIEGIALPMVHSAWLTATVFTLLNAWLLSVRIRCEKRALSELSHPSVSGAGG